MIRATEDEEETEEQPESEECSSNLEAAFYIPNPDNITQMPLAHAGYLSFAGALGSCPYQKQTWPHPMLQRGEPHIVAIIIMSMIISIIITGSIPGII